MNAPAGHASVPPTATGTPLKQERIGLPDLSQVHTNRPPQVSVYCGIVVDRCVFGSLVETYLTLTFCCMQLFTGQMTHMRERLLRTASLAASRHLSCSCFGLSSSLGGTCAVACGSPAKASASCARQFPKKMATTHAEISSFQSCSTLAV